MAAGIGGRVAGWLGSRLNIKPILSICVEGLVEVIAAHAGVGAWGVFYQVEDGNKRVAPAL